MTKKTEVSAEFMSFFGRNSTRIEQAKQAEARLQNIPLPIGANGTCIPTGFKLSKSQDRKNPDGTTKEGTAYAEMTFSVIDHPEHQGKTLRKQWWFATSANMDAAGRYEMFLGDMERYGLPREIRVNHESPAEIGDWFLNQPGMAFHFQIVEDARNTLDDGKSVRLSTTEQHIEATDSVAPPSVPKPQGSTAPVAPTPTAAPSQAQATVPSLNQTVKHLEMNWMVTGVFAESGKVQVKNVDDPRMEKIIRIDQIEG
jgi:hypothetical protein